MASVFRSSLIRRRKYSSIFIQHHFTVKPVYFVLWKKTTTNLGKICDIVISFSFLLLITN